MFIGDIRLGDTFDHKFTTIDSTGLPVTMAGTPVVSAYPGNSVTEITAGITLSVDFDSRTGLHNVRVVATSGNGYATATDYTLVMTAGTVSGISVVGYVVGRFSIEKRSALMPITAARTIDVDASGKVLLQATQTGVTIPTVTALTNAPSDSSGTTTLLGRVVGTVAAGTHNPQSGDSFPLVSTEVAEIYAAVITNAAGADIAADIIAVKGVVDTIQADTDLLDDAIGGLVDIHTDVAAVKVDTAAIAIDVAGLDGAVMRGTDSAALASVCTEGRLSELDAITAGKMAYVADVIAVDVAGLDGAAMRGTDSAALASVCTEARLSELDAGTPGKMAAVADVIAIDVAGLDGAAMRGTDSAALASVCTEGRLAELDAANLPTDIAARATPAQVNAEVLDVLNVDTFAEPGQEAPAATNTLAKKIGYLFKFLRNKVTQDATTLSVYDDAGTTVDQKASVSDDATTFTRGEIGSGP
jgi:hypothetical protein